MLKSVIKEEWKVFSEIDVGEHRTYSMEINLRENNPVQLNYNSVSQNLYNKLKSYINDLLSKK